ncbi:unnamed protein product [Closterium sp. NIES-54]
MATAINSATAEHSPLASASASSADCAFHHRSPSPCAATWSLPFRPAASASPSAMLLVLPDGSARLYTEELTVAQLACDFPDLVVSCSAIVAGDMCDGGVRDDCDSKAKDNDNETKPLGAILPRNTVLRLGGTYYLSNRDGPCSGGVASGAICDSRRISKRSSSRYTTSSSVIEDTRNREDYCTSGASISSSGDSSSFSGGSWRTFSSGDDFLCNRSDAGSSYSGNLPAVVVTGNESKRFLSKECAIACHRRSLSLVFADSQMPSPRQDVPSNGNQQLRQSRTPTVSRSGELSPAPSHVRSAQRPPAISSPVAHRRQFLRTTTPMRDRPIAPRHVRTRTEILGDAPILTDSLVSDAPVAGWSVVTSVDWASLQDTLRQNRLQLQRSQLHQSQLQPSQLQPSQQPSRAAHRHRNFSATTAVSPADWMSANHSASALSRDRMRSPGRARAQLAAHGASGRDAAAAGVVGGTALDRPVEACHAAVPAGTALRRCFSQTETRAGGGRVVWWGGEAEQAERQRETKAEDGEADQENDKTRIDNIIELEPDDSGNSGVVNGGECNEDDTNDLPDSPSSTSSCDSTDSEADANEAFWDSPRCFFSPLSLSLPRSPFSASVPAPSLLSLTNTPASKSADSPTTVTPATGTCDVRAPVTATSRPGHTRRRTMDICLPLPSLSPASVPATVSARKGTFSASQSPKNIPLGSAGNTGGAAAAAFSPSPLRGNSGCIAGRNPSPLPWVHARANSRWNSLPQPSSAPLDASWKVQEQNTSNSNGGSTSNSCGSSSSSSSGSSSSSSSSSNSRASSSRTSSNGSRKFSLLNFKALSISILSGNSSSSNSCTNSPHSPFSPSTSSEFPISTASSVSSFDYSFNSSFPHSSTSSSPASSASSPSSCFSSPTPLSSHSPSLPSPSHTPSSHLPPKQPTPSLLSPSHLLPPLAHPSPTSHLEAARPISPHCTQSLLCSHSPHSTASNPSHLPPLPSPSGLPGLSALQGHVGRAPVSPHSLTKGTGKVVRVSRFQRQEGEG